MRNNLNYILAVVDWEGTLAAEVPNYTTVATVSPFLHVIGIF